MLTKLFLLSFLLGTMLCGSYKNITVDNSLKTCNAVKQDIIDQCFDWKWLNTANQSEKFLGQKRLEIIQTVQISLPAKSFIMRTKYSKRPWYESDQLMPYELGTRTGTQRDLGNMSRCNEAGHKVDVLINLVAGDYDQVAVDFEGNVADVTNISFSTVPNKKLFKFSLSGKKDLDRSGEVCSCQLKGYKNQSVSYVGGNISKGKRVPFNSSAINFRIQNSKTKLPKALINLTSYSNYLNADCECINNTKPYYYDVNYYGKVKPSGYSYLGRVRDYTLSEEFPNIFCSENSSKSCSTWSDNPLNLASIYRDHLIFGTHNTQP